MQPSPKPTARKRSPVTLPEYRLGKPPANKGRKFPPQPFTRDEIDRLLRACGRRSSTGIRMAAMIAVMYRGGLRIAELLDLEPKDVDLELGTVRVLHGKRDKDRLVAIDQQACALVERWLRRRAGLGIPRSRHGRPTKLFCTVLAPDRGKPLWDSYVRERLHELGAKAEIDKRVHPHAFRHTHAFELRMEKIDMRVIQQQLGHTRLDTTARYMDHLAPEERIRLLGSRRWGAQPAAAVHAPDLMAELAALQDRLRALTELAGG